MLTVLRPYMPLIFFRIIPSRGMAFWGLEKLEKILPINPFPNCCKSSCFSSYT